jgi:Asp-tRNA(Asn)/Glu-tRNA(Gln) amidotransferase A subunit family amidase
MVRAPPAYCGGRSVTPRKIAAATAARAGSRVLVTANSAGVMCQPAAGHAHSDQPAGLDWTPGGLPVGVQLAAPYGREDLLIRVASQLEQAAPWADRHPQVHA